ncbi:hypothetical protein ACJRO7_018098, partial [Eucalyptus globulus]
SANDSHKDDEKENILVESDHPTSLGETDFLKGRIIKRKTSLDGIVEKVGNRAPRLDKSFSGSEETFGADISHLGHYSDITEKSLERSVSVICHLDSRVLLLVPVVSVLL